jgi:hypothetical protein
LAKTIIFSYLAYGKQNTGQISSSDGEGQEQDKEMNMKESRHVKNVCRVKHFWHFHINSGSTGTS